MKRSIVPFAHRERSTSPVGKRSRARKTREERLRDLETWCRDKNVTLSSAVRFDSQCIAGHGMRATRDIGIGEELVRIPRSATIRHSPKLAKAFKRYPDIADHQWISVILSLMAEWECPDSEYRSYVQWLPALGELGNIPHNWTEARDELKLLTGLDCQVVDDAERIDDDWHSVQNFLAKNRDVFEKVAEAEWKSLFTHCALLMMSYSFTNPEEEDESVEDSFCEEEEKSDPIRFMLPVGDLLNHTAENNARIEFDEDALTINSTRPILIGEEVFNTFGAMSNTRLLHMYGFAEENNEQDDAYILPQVIKDVVRDHNVDAVEAKIKLLDNHGFFDEVRLSGEDELPEQFRAMLAICALNRSGFNKMVKESKKKAKGGEIEELEVEIESNHIQSLTELERKIVRAVCIKMKERIEGSRVFANGPTDEVEKFAKFAQDGSLKVLNVLLEKTPAS